MSAVRFAELLGQRVAVWGYGREGRAALRTLVSHLPQQPLTLWCAADEADAARAEHPEVQVLTQAPDAMGLAGFDWVVKSPGISAYRPEILAAQAQGTRFTSGTALWFGARSRARVAAVTGTKGKSTTSAMLAHLARALGWRTALAGNIGLPLLDLLGEEAALWVVELSSFQTGETGPLELALVTNLYEEHLDWHGSVERYHADKLRMATMARTLLVDAEQMAVCAGTATHPRRRLFGNGSGWHADDAGIQRGAERVLPRAALPLPGAHNARNACAALAALELLGGDAVAAAPALMHFRGLPHRLQWLGELAGVGWVDDSISTTPAAVREAVLSLAGKPLLLILGGHDRGVDWQPFAAWLAGRSGVRVIVQGAAAARIAATLHDAGMRDVQQVDDVQAATRLAYTLALPGAVVLLSPGAPSFDQFRDYAERGRAFARLAGFDTAAIGEIAGMGIA